MKTRLGFVSNSSSSSFVCQVCGNTGGGYDVGVEDFYMFQCVNSHVICEDHAIENFKKDPEYSNFKSWYVPEKYCPVCQMKNITYNDIIGYILARDRIVLSTAEKEIRSKFNSHSELIKFNSSFSQSTTNK